MYLYEAVVDPGREYGCLAGMTVIGSVAACVLEHSQVLYRYEQGWTGSVG